MRSALGLSGDGFWFEIQPVSAGVFGVFAGTIVTVVVSLLPLAAAVPVEDDRS